MSRLFRFRHSERNGPYRDYYHVTLEQPMSGFPAGSQFEAVAVRGDGAIHGRYQGRNHFLGMADETMDDLSAAPLTEDEIEAGPGFVSMADDELALDQEELGNQLAGGPGFGDGLGYRARRLPARSSSPLPQFQARAASPRRLSNYSPGSLRYQAGQSCGVPAYRCGSRRCGSQ